MKSFAQLLAVILHPILIPFYCAALFYPLLLKYGDTSLILLCIWILFLHVVLPTIYLKTVKKINLSNPTISEREIIYKTMYGLTVLVAIVAVVMFKEYRSFTLALFLCYVGLYVLAALKMKASWHTAAWSLLFTSSLIVLYKYGFVNLEPKILAIAMLLILVYVIRLYQKAHKHFELLMGAALGALSSSIIFFI